MMKQYPRYVSVILDVAVDKALDYGVPEKLVDAAVRGSRVAVPVRGHLRYGYILEVKDSCSYPRVVPIHDVISSDAVITEELFEVALWLSKYYCSSLRQALKTIIPSTIRRGFSHKEQLFVKRNASRDALRKVCEEYRNKHSSQSEVLDVMLRVKKGIFLSELMELAMVSRSPIDSLVKRGHLSCDVVRVDRSPLVGVEYFKTKAKVLNDEQSSSFSAISKTLDDKAFATHLIYGVTGSGKTEVYLQAIQRALDMGRGAIMLVPEISLTAQTIERFKSRFSDTIAILHHRLSHGERYDEWHKILTGEARIVIGARSAIFSPVKDLGLIIVDEEHESSYKQEDEAPCYHARDVAVMRGSMSGAAVVLGSATPSLESFYNAQQGKYHLHTLHSRHNSATMPVVTIVDMKESRKRTHGSEFSAELLDGIKKRYDSGEQSLLFLNRRGYHTAQMCKTCGHVMGCENCDVAMTYHRKSNMLSCHLCGNTIVPPPRSCPECGSSDSLHYRGVGTEKIESALHAIFPEIRTIRLDADTTRHKGSHEKLLRDFRNGKADVLIGTQMIAKGLHFPEITLVGVLNSDMTLNMPDFRSSEQAFQLITQVSGRSGRGVVAGEVILQTYLPTNSTILHASRQDYTGFYGEEISSREIFEYPPFSQMVKISFSGAEEKATLSSAESFRKELLRRLPRGFKVHPVTPTGHAKVKNRYRFHFLVRGPSIFTLNDAINASKKDFPSQKKCSLLINISPQTTFF
jgi:primosomal protein N' (replication factor Y) (superfamily II helicase)